MGNTILVFAPHPDDEVLGCGGTMIDRITQGFEVYVVFMTDGSHSHPQIQTKKLKQLRRKEAVVANSILGIPEKKLLFLDFEDETLKKSKALAQDKVTNILHEIQPCEIYYPGTKDLHRDHRATRIIVERSMAELQYRPRTYQYAIWSFHGFTPRLLPFILLDFLNRKIKGKKLVQVDISGFLDLKKKAVLCYESQTSSLEGNNPTLSSSFLQTFLKNYEEFYACL